MTKPFLLYGVLSVVFAIIGFAPYIYTILKGRTKPEKSSWWIWSLLMVVALATQVAQGATWSLALTATFLFCNIAIATLALKHGYGHFKPRDVVAIVAAIFGIVFWVFTDNALAALLITISIDFLGNWLTMAKSWRAPYTENRFMWLMVSIASVFSLLAVGEVNTQVAIFPAYSVIVNTACFLVICNRRRWRSKRIIAGLSKAKA
jgi:hypothetical protein